MNNNLHAHVSTSSSDCDGSYSADRIMRMSEMRDPSGDFADMRFHEHVLLSVMSAYACVAGNLKVEGDPETGVTDWLEWTESTEEGHRWARAEFCEKEGCA